MALETKPLENIRDKFNVRVLTPDGKELEIKNCVDKSFNVDSNQLKFVKPKTIVTRNTLWRFDNYPYKSKRRRLIKKWAKKQGYIYKKSLGFSITFKDYEDHSIMNFLKEFGPKVTKVK